MLMQAHVTLWHRVAGRCPVVKLSPQRNGFTSFEGVRPPRILSAPPDFCTATRAVGPHYPSGKLSHDSQIQSFCQELGARTGKAGSGVSKRHSQSHGRPSCRCDHRTMGRGHGQKRPVEQSSRRHECVARLQVDFRSLPLSTRLLRAMH
eukprot:scaffold287219_cov40-Prasinocladus_malaysianus.AAC.3